MSIQLLIGPDAITSYKRLSYTPWHAIAEFVDNSTQSYFDNKVELDTAFAVEKRSLQVRIVYDQESEVLRIFDNALGMSYEELQRALHVALPPTNTAGRSKYGMGLKTAACWIGNKWSITTKRLGETVEHSVLVDVGTIASGGSELPYSSVENRDPKEHYTYIEIKDHNHTFRGRTLGKIREFLRSMYREDFRNRVLTLEWQGTPLAWEEVTEKLLVSRDGRKYKKNFEFEVNGKRVCGWVGILAQGSRETAGFSIIHSGRMIRGYPDSWRPTSLYGQLQGSNDLVNQRLIGEVHLDDFEVSHTKDDILWLGDEEEEVERGLKQHCADYREAAKEYRKHKDDQRGPSEIETNAAIDELKKELMSPEMVDLIEIEPVPAEDAVEEAVQKITESVTTTRDETFRYNVGGLIVRLYIVADMSPNDPYVTVDATQASEVIVIINHAHPHWGQLKGSEGVLNYIRHCTYDAIAEWQARSKASRIDPDTIKLLKDKLLRVPFYIDQHAAEEEPVLATE
jgi:hypothetical protein